jgi:hypothetical protein
MTDEIDDDPVIGDGVITIPIEEGNGHMATDLPQQ